MNEKIRLLSTYIEKSHSIAFFGGAGVSTDSGIPDFRSKDGLYNQKYAYSPEKILSYSYFSIHPFLFFDFYKEKMDVRDKKPNFTHIFLAELEKKGKLKTIITQNIDGLHQKAGSKNVIELHGSIYDNYCMKCLRRYDANKVFESENIPTCVCGGIIKPNVILYEEALDANVLKEATEKIKKADLLIIGGTSLQVFPANTLIQYFHGKRLVIINEETTDFDNRADLIIHHKISDVFKVIHKNSV